MRSQEAKYVIRFKRNILKGKACKNRLNEQLHITNDNRDSATGGGTQDEGNSRVAQQTIKRKRHVFKG